jgi:hypothetical protein
MQASLYHKILRTLLIVIALVLVFDSGAINEATKHLANDTQSYMANVIGVGASVAPTELNSLTAELTAQKRALDEREALLAQREISIGLQSGAGTTDYSTYILAGILFILLVLILLNYTLDYLRSVERRDTQTV